MPLSTNINSTSNVPTLFPAPISKSAFSVWLIHSPTGNSNPLYPNPSAISQNSAVSSAIFRLFNRFSPLSLSPHTPVVKIVHTNISLHHNNLDYRLDIYTPSSSPITSPANTFLYLGSVFHFADTETRPFYESFEDTFSPRGYLFFNSHDKPYRSLRSAICSLLSHGNHTSHSRPVAYQDCCD